MVESSQTVSPSSTGGKRKTKVTSKIKQFFVKVLSTFQKEEEPEYELPKSWGKGKSSSGSSKSPKTAKTTVTMPKIRFPKVKKVKVPGLRKAKRYGAGLLFLVSCVIVLAGATTGANALLTLLFLLYAFYMLDYLWKTRRPKEL